MVHHAGIMVAAREGWRQRVGAAAALTHGRGHGRYRSPRAAPPTAAAHRIPGHNKNCRPAAELRLLHRGCGCQRTARRGALCRKVPPVRRCWGCAAWRAWRRSFSTIFLVLRPRSDCGATLCWGRPCHTVTVPEAAVLEAAMPPPGCRRHRCRGLFFAESVMTLRLD